MTVQGPVKKQQPDGMSHWGADNGMGLFVWDGVAQEMERGAAVRKRGRECVGGGWERG